MSMDQHIAKSFAKGREVEALFKELMEEQGFKVFKSPDNLDIQGKVDYIVFNKYGKQITFDVKSCKNRHHKPNPDEILVEFSAVGGQYPGWMFSEKLNLVAFQRDGYFLIVDRKELLAFVLERVENMGDPKPESKDCYETITRPGRGDEFCWVPVKDIENNLSVHRLRPNADAE